MYRNLACEIDGHIEEATPVLVRAGASGSLDERWTVLLVTVSTEGFHLPLEPHQGTAPDRITKGEVWPLDLTACMTRTSKRAPRIRHTRETVISEGGDSL
jgi:hypothetical protein